MGGWAAADTIVDMNEASLPSLCAYTLLWVAVFVITKMYLLRTDGSRPKASPFDTFTNVTTNTHRARGRGRRGGAYMSSEEEAFLQKNTKRAFAVVSSVHAALVAVHAAYTLVVYCSLSTDHCGARAFVYPADFLATADSDNDGADDDVWASYFYEYGISTMLVTGSYVMYDLGTNAYMARFATYEYPFPWSMVWHHAATVVAMACASYYGEEFYTAMALLSEFSTPFLHACKNWRDDMSPQTMQRMAGTLLLLFLIFRVLNFPVIAATAAARFVDDSKDWVYAYIAVSMGFLAVLNWYWFYRLVGIACTAPSASSSRRQGKTKME